MPHHPNRAPPAKPPPPRPARNVALVLSLNEAERVTKCLRSLHAQTLKPDAIILADSHSTDDTVQLAAPLVTAVIDCPKGKLTATDHAIRALPPTVSIIACCDADTEYPPHWFEAITRPFEDPRVVLVHGPLTLNSPGFPSLVNQFVNTLIYSTGIAGAGMNRALQRWAYLACGGFNLGGNQRYWPTTWLAEEVNFKRDMERVGLTRWAPDAWCLTSARRLVPPGHPDHDATHAEQVATGQRF